jgi:hypothetical protein
LLPKTTLPQATLPPRSLRPLLPLVQRLNLANEKSREQGLLAAFLCS